MHNQSETLTKLVRAQESLELERQAELRATAHALIQAHVGWNRKVVSVERFYSAIVDALLQARSRAQADCSGEAIITVGLK
jgi:hypothetical protein